jgi:cytochrome c-type biogenesis protein CcmH
MTRKRSTPRLLAVALSAALALVAALSASRGALGQQLGEGMDRSGVLDIRDDHERQVFAKLECTCGCPRESIATCTCVFAAGFRSEVRAMLAQGLTVEDIKAEWARRHGPQALMVPPNTGFNQLVYLVPLAAIAGMAAFAVLLLRRFRRRNVAIAGATAPPVAGAKRDDYDDKLDEELRQLDDE